MHKQYIKHTWQLADKSMFYGMIVYGEAVHEEVARKGEFRMRYGVIPRNYLQEDIMYKSFSMELAGRTLTVDIGRVAKQANGAALMHYGDTVVLSTATASEKPRDGIDFFPLSVEYNERLYAVGKIPGGFNKREGKASENAILTCRVIDRPMRP